MLFTSQSLYATNFIAPVSVHSLTVSYLPVLVTLQPRYTFRVLQRDIGVRRCARIRSASSVLRPRDSNVFRELFFIVSRFHWFPVPTTMELLTKVCSLQSDSLKSIKITGFLFITLISSNILMSNILIFIRSSLCLCIFLYYFISLSVYIIFLQRRLSYAVVHESYDTASR